MFLAQSIFCRFNLASLRMSHLGPLHVVCFGCWFTWSISSWQEYYKSHFFPKAEWWVAELFFFCLSITEAWIFCKMNVLNPLRFTTHQKNWEKCFLNFWMRRFTKTSILPNCQVPNRFFLGCKFTIQNSAWPKKTLL